MIISTQLLLNQVTRPLPDIKLSSHTSLPNNNKSDVQPKDSSKYAFGWVDSYKEFKESAKTAKK